MDGIEIILVSVRKEALHRTPDLRRIAAIAIENEPAVHMRVDPRCRRLLRLPCRAARNDRLPAIIKQVERSVMKLSQEREMFEQCAREVLRLIDDDVRILPQCIIEFILKKRLELA